MSWQPVDCHAHSDMSDGQLTVAEIVDRARACGVRPSVADHISHDIGAGIKSVEAVDAYLTVLERYDVLRGGEFCWHDTLWREIPEEMVRRFSHRIGSLHAIALPSATGGGLVRVFSRRFPDGLTPDAYMDAHLDNLECFAREMPVDILAHPTLLPLPLRSLPVERLWTEAREERAVRALAAGGIAFEVSARYPPHEGLVRRAVAAGVRLALGSDGHTADQVANVLLPLQLIRAVGVPDHELYDPVLHGSRTQLSDRGPA